MNEAYRVLVLDDEPHAVEMLLRMLHGHYRAVGSTSAAEALDLIEDQSFDVVLQCLFDGVSALVDQDTRSRPPRPGPAANPAPGKATHSRRRRKSNTPTPANDDDHNKTRANTRHRTG